MASDAKVKERPKAAPRGRGASLPKLSEKELAENLAKAARARSERAAFLAEVKSGKIPVEDAMSGGGVVDKVPVKKFLLACPGIGVAKATKIMDEIGISANRRMRGLGHRQREALLAVLLSGDF